MAIFQSQKFAHPAAISSTPPVLPHAGLARTISRSPHVCARPAEVSTTDHATGTPAGERVG